jgi:uncharacterized protein YacL
MYVALTRIIFLVLSAGYGYWWGQSWDQGTFFAVIGLLLAGLFLVVEHNTDIISSKKILLASVGLILGLITAGLLATTFEGSQAARPIFNIVCGYLGVIMALKHADRFNLSKLNFLMNPGHRIGESNLLLDTNVIIDGRLKEIIPTGFLNDTLIIPQFVLDELHRLADSSDPQRRIRGKRGLANLDYLSSIERRIEIYDIDYEEVKEVDHKLQRLAQDLGAKILTNDNNLRAVAQLHGVEVLSLNDLTNAVRPVAHVGEPMRIEIVREGKEPNQGVGYLDDGTMVVIDDGASLIGRKIDIVVTSVLQTSAGRMIFARPKVRGGGQGNGQTGGGGQNRGRSDRGGSSRESRQGAAAGTG